MSKDLPIPQEVIVDKIHEFRGEKVMLSHDLAELYQVETRVLNQQVKRNINRFPDRYIFKLTTEEHQSLRSQIVTLNRGRHSKYPPYAFTEHGILMLSSVLRSERAEKMNILIIDTFVRMREMLLTHKDLLLEMENIRKKVAGQDTKIELIFNYLKKFIKQDNKRVRIGYGSTGKEE